MPATGSMTWNEVLRLAADAVLNGTGTSPADITAIAADVDALVVAAQDTTAVNVYPLPTTPVSGLTAAMTGTTSTQLLAAPGSGLRNYVTALIISNTHATVDTEVAIQDGNGGTALLTVPAPADYGGAVIALPTPLKQPTLDTALYCVNLTTGASVKVTAVGFTAP